MDGGSERKAGKRATIGETREENRSESGAVNQRRARERRERREWSEPRAEAAKERRREGQRGDTTRVVHPVLDDEQVETRTTTASYPRPPDRSINGEIDAFSGQTDRVLTYVARSAAQVFFTLQAATTTCIVQSRQTISYAILELVCWKNTFLLSPFVHSGFCSRKFRMTVHRVGCTPFKLRE